ncbi:MAG TPA: hypothetical protein VG944_03230 [Fimbriimonas sp.]|nr:hypothetical protein [Fimbriimonas sp.]
MLRALKFGKPKNPGFGLSANFYLSVLSSRPVMPSLVEIVNPNGEGGAVSGLGAPLASASDKEALTKPLERGAYALATKDRKTVIKMLVLSKEEASFDPEPFARSDLAMEVSSELLARVRATWTLAQLTFESHDPMVYPALDFLLEVAKRLADQTDGVVADPICRRYLLPEEVIRVPRMDPRVDSREHLTINFRARPDGQHVYTLGMQKFGLPELEILGLGIEDAVRAARFLLTLAQTVLLGDLIRSGDRFGAPSMPFEARHGGFDNALWEGLSVYELLPPTAITSSEALIAWDVEAQRLGPSF